MDDSPWFIPEKNHHNPVNPERMTHLNQTIGRQSMVYTRKNHHNPMNPERMTHLNQTNGRQSVVYTRKKPS